MTHRLFYENPYLTSCESEIQDVIEKGSKLLVVLDRTPFYPEGGGQPSDTGYIGDSRVSYVFEEGNIIYHEVDEVPEGTTVKCKVDFDRRFDHIQQHSGEHLLSAAFFKLYNGVNYGFHMGEDYVTIDINIKDVSDKMLKEVEQEVNSYIFRNEEVKTYNVPKEQALRLPLRKEIKVEGNIRIVQIGNMDYSACCGTHVVRSGEIGIVKIIKAEKYKGMTRIYFKCGKRAFDDYVNKHSIVQNLSRFFASEESEIVSKVESQAALIKDLNRTIAEFKKAAAINEAQELLQSEAGKLVSKCYEDKAMDEIQLLADILEKSPRIFILSSLNDKRIIVFHNGSFDINIGKLFKEFLSSYNGRGGGNDKKAQAAFTSEADMASFSELIKNRINEI